jgi:CheY-like chemotaxis protein
VPLPALARGAAVVPAVEGPAPAAAPAGVARRVLYIEDNRVNQIVVESMLAQLPRVTVALASDPADGLRQAFEQPPDLVLLDIQLPGMSGFEVLQQLRQHPATRAVPVVAVSANAMPEDLARAREAGFDDYVTKPLDLDVLLRAVRRLPGAAAGLRFRRWSSPAPRRSRSHRPRPSRCRPGAACAGRRPAPACWISSAGRRSGSGAG